jgi:hypothetical protein
MTKPGIDADGVAKTEADHFGNCPQPGIFGNAAHPDHIDARRRCDRLRVRHVRYLREHADD